MNYKYEKATRKYTLLHEVPDIEPYEILLPEPPAPEMIGNYGLPKEQQIFQKEVIPRGIWELTNRVNSDKISREEAFSIAKKDSELSAFIQSQWKKRVEGDWVYVNGKPYYLTGTYWFYLNYYILETGRCPEFRLTDLEEFLWWKFCVEENESCYGGIMFTRRRVGKTFKAGCIQLEYATRSANSKAGVQSKSEQDASEYFRKAVVYQFKRLPFFFKPSYETAGKMKKEIAFVHDDPTLSFDTFINFESSTDTAYDGQKLHRYVLDECGKMQNPVDPIRIWDKVRPCLEEGNKIVGKALLTTTVEDLERGGGDKFKYLWNTSSRMVKDGKMNELGETESGLIPYFTSGYRNMFFDKYGMPIVEKPTKEQMEWRKTALRDKDYMYGGKEYVDIKINSAKSASAKQDRIRKYAPTIRDAFRYSNQSCLFDIEIINSRLSDFFGGAESIYPSEIPMTFGYFQWVKGKEFKEAEFIATDEKQARVHVRMLPHPNERNRFVMRGDKQLPANTTKFNAGCDPFKLKTEQIVHKDRMSLGAGHVFALWNPEVDQIGKPREEWLTDNLVLEYMYRPETPDLFAEDMAMICVFYGCKMFPENNIDVVDRKFREWGMEEYLQFRHKVTVRNNIAVEKEDKKLAGAYNIEAYKPTLIRHGMNFIREKGMYCPFPRTLESMRDMSYENFTDYDLGVSALYTLTGTFDHPQEKKVTNRANFGKDIPIPDLRTYSG